MTEASPALPGLSTDPIAPIRWESGARASRAARTAVAHGLAVGPRSASMAVDPSHSPQRLTPEGAPFLLEAEVENVAEQVG